MPFFYKKFRLLLALFLLFAVPVLPGCAVVGGIFRAGVWVGVVAVLLVVGIIIWIVSKASNKN